MIYVECYNCGSNKYDNYLEENGYKLVKCKCCGLLYVNPRLSEKEIDDSTRHGTHKGHNTLFVTGSYNESKVGNYVRLLSLFFKKDELNYKTWYDLGCGHGEFMKALKIFSDNKINVKGFEPNIEKADSAKTMGLNVVYKLSELEKANADFISSLNVFSHLSNPVEEIKNWSLLIKSKGKLFLETGNTSHLPNYYHPKPLLLPDHLSFANKKIIKSILFRSGFSNFKIRIFKIRERELIRQKIIRFIKDLIILIIKREKKIIRFTKYYSHLDMFVLACKR